VSYGTKFGPGNIQIQKDAEPAILCLAPIKCETYFSKASKPEIADNFFKAFIRDYSLIISAARDACPHCKILYTPVESVGCIKLQKMEWNIRDNEASPRAYYKIIPPYQQEIAGVEALTDGIYRFGADRIRNVLQEIFNEKTKARDDKTKDFQNRDLFTLIYDFFTGDGTRKMSDINESSCQVEAIRESLEKLCNALAELADRHNGRYFKEL
jgi:hypothetical protein